MKWNLSNFFISSLFILFTKALLSQTKKELKHLNIAKQEIIMNNYQGAVIELNEILEKEVNNMEALFLRGICLDSLKKYSEALQDYNDVISFSSNIEAYKNRAYIRYRNRNYYQAIFDFEKYIEHNPNDALVYFHLASAYGSINNQIKAICHYSNAIIIDSNYSFAYANRGFNKYLLEDFTGAINDYDKAILINPDKNLITNRANIKAEMKNYEGAIIDNSVAIELQNSDNDSLQFYNRGSCKILMKDYKGAIDDLNRAIELNPKCADYFSQRGLAKQLLMNYQDAINDYSMAILINPKAYRSYNNRGNIYYELKNMESACSDWYKTLELVLAHQENGIENALGWDVENVKKLVSLNCK